MAFNHLNRSSCHRRSVSCIASHDELTYYPIEVVEEEDSTSASASEDGSSVSTASRVSDGISMAQLQRSLMAISGDSTDGAVSAATGSIGGKIKVRECFVCYLCPPRPSFSLFSMA